jgi:fatty-acyl-CoA synthase
VRLHDFLDFHGREHPDQVLGICGDRRLSYGEGLEVANRLANALASAGLGRGDRFAYLSKNCLEYPLIFMAASKIGAVPVPLNYRLAPPELAYIANDSESRLLIARGEYVEAVDGLRSELKTVETFIAQDADPRAGWEAFHGWVGAQPVTAPDREISPNDDLYQMYTSGTTGRPKGAIVTHRAAIGQLSQQIPAFDARREDRVLIVAPIYHAAAAITALGAVALGSTLVVHEDFDPAAVVRALSEDGITRTTLVPAMIQACLVFVPEAAERSYDALRLIVYGASPIAAETLKRAMEVFRCGFAQGYGMTETTAQLTLLGPEDHRRALAGRPELLLSAGRPLPGTEIRIVDEHDSPVANGTIGEIVGRGPQLMRGYWNLPDASAEALKDGWLHTGDAGILDDEGYLYIQDRTKDMIVSGGENVYPREIENVLFEHPGVADVAVIGIPDEKWGETVKAIIVLREGQAVTAEAVIEFCKGKLAGYKRPRSVDFIEALPRNASGKVLKKELREKYWVGRTRRVS